MKKLQWGIIGAGAIANETAEALKGNDQYFRAIFNRTYQKAVDYAERHNVEKVYKTAEELLADPEIDAVYIATLHNYHYQYMKLALNAGKHVLCEKAITLNSAELDELRKIAAEKNLVLAEAMTIYHMPLFRQIAEMISSGKSGKVFMITVNFGSYRPYDPESRFFALDKAGGAMLDIGVYALALARYFLSEQPDQIVSLTKPSFAGSDEQFGIVMQNSCQEMAAVTLSMHVKQPKRAVISCENGYFEIMEFPRADSAVYVDGKTKEETVISAGDRRKALQYEFADMEQAILNNDSEIMKPELTRDVMEIMTRLRYEWGYKFPEEN